MSYASALSRGSTPSETNVSSQSPPQEKKQPQKPTEKGAPKGKQEQKSPDATDNNLAGNQQQAKGANPKPNKPQAKIPTVKLEGNGGGDFKALTVGFSHPGEKGKGGKSGSQKRRFSKPLTFRQILLKLGAPSAFLLGSTCKAFSSELHAIQSSKDNFNPHTKVPHLGLILHYIEPPKPAHGAEENAEKPKEEGKVVKPPTLEGELKKLTPGDFQGAVRGKSLIKYWQKVVEVAQYKRSQARLAGADYVPSKKNLDVNLGGGLIFREHHGYFLDTQDLSTLHRWLEATVKLLQGDKKQVVPYLNGQVSLIRIGAAGNCVLVRRETPDAESSQHLYKFDDFCEAIRNVVKGFLPIVGSFVNISVGESTKVDQTSNEQYLERETIIKNILQPSKLDNYAKLIKDLILKGSIIGSDLPEQYKEKAAAKRRQTLEMRSAVSFFADEFTEEDFAQAARHAKTLADEHARERDAAEQLRKQEREQEREAEKVAGTVLKKRDAKGDIIKVAKRDAKPAEPEKDKKPIVKKKTEKTADGFNIEVTEISDPKTGKLIKKVSKSIDGKTGALTSTITTYEADGSSNTVVEKEKAKKPATVAKVKGGTNEQVAHSLLAANPFSATMQADTVETPTEILLRAQEARSAATQAAQKVKEEKRAKVEQQQAKAKAKAATNKPVETAKEKQAREEEERRAAKERQEAQRQEQAKKEAQKKAAVQKQQQDKAAKKALAATKKKPVAFYEDENFQPLLIGLGLLIVFVAFGYAFTQQ